jgi:hypothetical protein
METTKELPPELLISDCLDVYEEEGVLQGRRL